MSRRIVLVAALTVGILGLVLVPSVAGLVPDAGEPAAVLDGDAVAQSSVDCSACHDDPVKVDFPNSDVCAQCHVNIGIDYQKSVHSEKTDTHANFACMECHEEPEDSWFMHFQRGPHGDQKPGVTNAPEQTCSQSMCHDDQNPYGPVYAEWEETEDADWSQEMLSHSKQAPSVVQTEECSACHGTHEGSFANIERAPEVSDLAVEEQPDPETVEEWRITCSACHDPHDVRPNDVLRGDFESSSQLCAQCHTSDVAPLTDSPDAAAHPSIWAHYSTSAFADADGRHPQLECASCHMASMPRGASGNAITGHSFEVNTSLLSDTDRLAAPAEQQCGTCHQDLAGTIAAATGHLESDLTLARQLEGEAEQAVAESGLEDDEQIVADLQEGSAWLDFVDTATAGVHNSDLAQDRLRDAIERFAAVKSQAYGQVGDGSDGATTTTTTIGPAPTTSTPSMTTTTETETPGLGMIGVLVALLSLAMLARRRA